MKMAIIGSGPLALLSARYFDELGAHVTLFQRGPLGGNISFLNEKFPDFDIKFNGKSLSANEFFREELVPLVKEIEERELPKVGDVLRVHKRFLHAHESVPGRTRLFDFFRVISSTNPQETILKQVAENPEFFKQLGDDVIDSLHLPVESFEDFDLVIEATGFGKSARPIGAGGAHALNERNLKESSLIYYEKDIFEKLDLKEKKTIVIIGEGVSAKLALLHLKKWLFESPEHSLHWVTYEPVKNQTGNKWLDCQIAEFFNEVKARFEKNKEEFEGKLRDWRNLDDYVKVKIPRPIEPVPILVTYEGYDVTSVDRLLDRQGVFATLESPEFRHFAQKPNDMLTLFADALCVARGVHREESCAENLADNEPGFYKLSGDNLENALTEIKAIEEKVLNYFKRA